MKKRLPGISGFTLMELLISITILSVIVLLIMSALRLSTNAWEKGEKNIESGQRLRAAIGMIAGQIEAIRTDKAYQAEDGTYFLKGNLHALEFVTTIPSGYDGTPQPTHVAYSVEAEDASSQLILTERKIPVLPPLPDNTEVQVEENRMTLIPVCYDAHFEYLKSITEEEGQQWQETWDPFSETGLPLAIRVVLRENETDSPVAAIARIIRDPAKTVSYRWNVN